MDCIEYEDSMDDNVDIEMVPSDPEYTNGEESNVGLGVQNKVENLKVSVSVSGEKRKKIHEVGEFSNKENTREEVKTRADSRNEAKSKKKVTKSVRSLKKKKKASRRKTEGSLISIPRVDEDGMTDNFDTEMVPSNPVIIGKGSMISGSMHDEGKVTGDVAAGMATSDENGRSKNVDAGTATSKQIKMKVEKSNAVPGMQGKVEHLKEREVGDVSCERNRKGAAANEVDSRNEAKNEEKQEANARSNVHKLTKACKRKKIPRGMNKVVAKKTVKPEFSNMTRMKDKATGMIFMCSSKTKEDCFHYKVLGLPANKRDMVFKIYEGMRLFLFDYDLKLMYGIYKAAGPGGYNIEPKAFKSAFPSQVRFTVLDDCLPVAEETFKRIIKDNYYSNNKFNFQLTSKQVNNLCKLFKVASKGSKSNRLHESPRAEAPIYVDHSSKRACRSLKSKNCTDLAQLCQGPSTETQAFLYHDQSRLHNHGWKERHPAYDRNHPYLVGPGVYRKQVYASRMSHPILPRFMHPPLPSTVPPLETDVYRRDQLQCHDKQPLHVEMRHQDEFEQRVSFRRFHHGEFKRRDSFRRFRRDEFEVRDSHRRSRCHNENEHRDSYRRRRHEDEFERNDSYRRSRRQDEFENRDSCRSLRVRHLGRGGPSSYAAKPPGHRPHGSRRPTSKHHSSSGPTL